jgi:microcystin-dependent protein
MAQPYIGEIRMGGWNFAPADWAFCDGSLISISQNSTLFTLIGTTYGGNGTTTFALPDFRGRVPVHQGTDANGNPYAMGQISGAESVTLTTTQIPVHNHPLEASTEAATSTIPTGLTFAVSTPDVYAQSSDEIAATSAGTTMTGGGQQHDNRMPYQCVTFIIAEFGIYPSQN